MATFKTYRGPHHYAIEDAMTLGIMQLNLHSIVRIVYRVDRAFCSMASQNSRFGKYATSCTGLGGHHLLGNLTPGS